MSALVLIVQPAHFWIQEATTRRPIVRYAVKANTLRRLEPQRQPHALTVWRANMQHSKGAMKRVTAYCVAWASIRPRRAPRKQARANCASRASFPPRAVTMRSRIAKPAGRASILNRRGATRSRTVCRAVWARFQASSEPVPWMPASRARLGNFKAQ